MRTSDFVPKKRKIALDFMVSGNFSILPEVVAKIL